VIGRHKDVPDDGLITERNGRAREEHGEREQDRPNA
jgi:hypothetical protein